MEIKLQKLLFPDQERYRNYDRLFFKSVQSVYDDEKHCLAIARYNGCDFMTYLNAFSMLKWKRYTGISDIFLRLDIEGEFKLSITGYHLEKEGTENKKIYYTQKYALSKRQILEIPLPDMEETLVSFEINALTDCFIYSGEFYTDVNKINEVTLSIAITTFKKEDFVKKNLKLIREKLLTEESVGSRIYVHVVDNGRTLDRTDVESDHIFYHSNKNVGGSGGFSRGMLESLHQTPKATNVLLMDDDVEILPESIRRTCILLMLLKTEYKDRFISGAMLRYEHMNEFWEDIGYMCPEGYQITQKGHRDLNKKRDILYVEEYNTSLQNSYAGWWYCCIPASVIEKSGYALPIFVRGDDTEYSIRNHARFITMNGICVWHMGFTTKFNYFMEYYQTFRNLLIMEACNKGEMQERILNFFMGMFLSEVLQFNYQAGEFLLDAVRDYLKGPAFIEEERCQERLTEMSGRNAVLKDVKELSDVDVDFNTVYAYEQRNIFDTLLYKFTFNGQFLWPKKWLRPGPAIIAYDTFYNPQRHCLKESVISVNPYTKTAEERHLDKKKFKKIMAEYRKVMKQYKAEHKKVNEQYYQKRKYLVSEEFWKNYLEIEKYQ